MQSACLFLGTGSCEGADYQLTTVTKTRSGAVFAAPLELGPLLSRAVKLEAEDPGGIRARYGTEGFEMREGLCTF
jgi:hypothetical protein